jgi:hypothetical protein
VPGSGRSPPCWPAISDRRQMRIVHEVARRPERLEELPDHRAMPVAWMDDDGAWLGEPELHDVEGAGQRLRPREDMGARAQPDEREQQTQVKATVSSPERRVSSHARAEA